MKDKNMTKEQFENELAKLRQENIELKLALKDQERIFAASACSSPSPWFSTGKNEIVFNSHGQQSAVNQPAKYKFSDLVDIELIKKLLDSFYIATGIPYGLNDEEHNIVSVKGWQDICTHFHRICPQTECRCQQSDRYIAGHLHEGPYVSYKCLNGLIDFATPIIVEDQHIATILLGQFLHEPPDEEFFRRQAQEYGFDEAAYMEALHRVPIIPEDQIKSIMEFYSQLGQILATMGLDRKRQLEIADQTIREQQERLNLVWEISNDGFWDWNIASNKLYFSPCWSEMLGYSQEELAPHFHTWRKLLHPDDVTAAMKAIAEHLHGLTAKCEFEYRTLTKSGKWKWVMARGRVVDRNEEGQPLRMVGINLDITDRKQTELALLQSQEKFHKAFHCNPDPMSITTLKEGLYVQVNDAYLKATGYRENEVIGHTAGELNIWAVTEERDIIIKQINKCIGSGNIETEFRSKSGEIRTVLMSGEILDIGGEAHLLITTRDITKRKTMEEALRLSEECFSKAFDASPIIMGIATLSEERFIKVNHAFCRVTGYSHEEAIGKSILELGLWADPATRYRIKQRLAANRSLQEMEICFCRKTGEQRVGLFSAERLDINGEPCILGLLSDITELRQMEVEMNRLDRLNLVGEMAASIGHEIRNPMTTVRGYLQLLRENKDYVQEIEYFNLMIEELDRANSIITEFLSLAKNKMVELQPASLNTIISKLLPLIQAKAISRDLHIKVELDELPELLLDQKEIRQLILNLVNNGMESMSSVGEITIRNFMNKEKVVLAVKDQGHGIERELLDKLGTPFFTTKDQGTGLGLAVCYRIAARHNAKIDIETSSTGTTFYVRFPIPTVEDAVS